ncbi:S-layer homology domain-containing protein [Paenibacillus daejeonensis]|uniref:S-layer homology domain-containing protein n=1 Tax=Paenibacillus daejeonensis TaxID=135193 RepID=UPI001B7FA87F|nr:S-layer homology domain-containing protein [Paenibacillus daejeonensis]
MKRVGIVFLAFLLIFTGTGVNLGTLVSHAASSDVYVASNGDDDAGEGTRENPYASLQKAYQEVNDEGTIYVLDNITLLRVGGQFVRFELDKVVTISTAPAVENPAVIQRGEIGTSSGGTLFDLTSGRLTLKDIIIDGSFGQGPSNGRIINVNTNAALTIEEGTILRNNFSAYEGSAIFLMGANPVLEMTGGEIVGNRHASTGAVYIGGANATFRMTGGTITGNSGGGVHVAQGYFHLSGDPVITDNTSGASPRNVFLTGSNLLRLSGDFTGQAGITAQSRMTAGSQFGIANPDLIPVTGLDNLFPDTGTLVAGYAEGTSNLVWREVVAVDKTQLQAKVNEIHDEALVPSTYTEESWQTLQDALDAAQAVLDSDNVTQVEIDQALSQVEAARDHLTAIVTPPASPGGVLDGLLSWVDVGRSAEIVNGNVTLLNDLAVNEQWARHSTNASIPYTAAAVNYNPGITITAASAYFIKPTIGSTADTEREVFSVQASDSYGGFPWDLGGTGPATSVYGLDQGGKIRTYFGSNINKTVDVQGVELKKSRVMNIWSSQSEGWSFSLDGKTLLEEANNQNTVHFGYAAGRAYIGAGHNSRFNGSVSEVIVFDRKLNEHDRLRVNSYLALKYGLTLPTDYIDSSSVAMWTQGDSSDHSNRIAGVGRDDLSGLYQKQSRSQEVGAHVTIALGHSVAASNEANLSAISNDRSFIVFGDNGMSTSFVDSIDRADEQLKRTERVYKVKKTNWQDINQLTESDTKITLQIDPVEGAVDGPLYVVFSSDDQFDATDSFYLIEDGQVTIDTKDFGNVSYFTLAALVPTLETAVLEQPETGGPRIVLTLDQEIGLSNLNGFTITINDTEVDISTVNFEVDPANKDQLILKQPVGTVVTDNEVKVIYDGTGTLKGTNGVPAAPFEQVAADEFASALQIIEPSSQIVNVSRPAIEGTSVPEATISIVIRDAEGHVVNGAGGTVEAEEDGSWSFTPPVDLAEGSYTIEAKATKDGKTATKTKTLTVVNKTALQSEVDEINNDLEETDYTPDSWQELEQALSNAQQVLDNSEATQEEVDQALEALETARNELQRITVLPTPVAQLSEEGVLSWEEITHADTYEVTIEIEGQEPLVVVVNEGTELDLSGLEPPLTPGTYSVNVVAKSSNPAYTDSEPSEEVTYVVSVALPAPVAQLGENGALTWEEVTHADTYEVTIEVEGEEPLVIVVSEGTELDLSGLEPPLAPGTYSVTVTAKSSNPAYTDSDPSEEVTYVVAVPVDKTALQNKVTEINEALAEEILVEEQYTGESWQALQKALSDAENVLADPDALQEEVDAALDVLENARKGLVKSKQVTIIPSIGALSPTANDGVYTITVGHSTSQISFTVTPADPDAQITIHGQNVENGVASSPIALNVGLNEITILVTGQDEITRTYKIQVTREAAPETPVIIPVIPSPPSTVERITVDVEARGKGVVAQTEILRTTNSDGTKSDQVSFGATIAEESVRKTLEAGATTVRIVIPDEKDEVKEVRVDLTAAALAVVQQSGLDLEIYTDNGLITIPNASLTGLDNNLYFHLIPIKQESERKLVEQRAKTEELVRELLNDGNVYVVDRPFTIETNMPSRKVYLTLPMNDSNVPTGTANRERFLSDLAIFIEHSDGERKVVTPEIGGYAEGKRGLTFGIEKFSTFTILNLDSHADGMHSAYIIGYPDGTFKPLHALTRAQIAVILHRVLELEGGDTEMYPDVSSSHWASEAISYVSSIGLMEGMPDGSFQPDRDITRAEMAIIIARLKNLNGEASHSFSDVVAGHWAEQDIANVLEAGLMEGMPDGSFQPNKILTRAEAVTVFNRVLGRGPLYGMNQSTWPDVPMDHWAFHQIEEASQDHYYQLRPTGGEVIVK